MNSTFELAEIFNDNMVFQSGKPIKIFGKCKKNLDMRFKLLDNEIKFKTDSNTFMVEFPAIEDRETSFSFTVETKKEEITVYNCVIGDVYLFLGGMNISMTLADSFHNQDYDFLSLRFFTEKTDNYEWVVADKSNFETFGALAYLFSKGMHEIIKTPIGIINCTHKGSRIFSWMSNSDIKSNKEIKMITDKYSDETRMPLYRMVKEKVVPFQIKAIIFYQGENDYPYYSIYENALRMIIKSLRFDFNDLKLPFILIQIAGYDHPDADDYNISMIRIAQSNITSEKDNIYLVSAIDFGDPEDINPKDKHLVAKRLTNLVLEKLYHIGKNTISPQYFSYQEYPDYIMILTKDNYLNLVSKSGQYLGFTYTVDGKDFQTLKDITIRHNMILIQKNQDMKEIRYAMKKYPTCDIVTTNDLPLLPFYIKLY